MLNFFRSSISVQVFVTLVAMEKSKNADNVRLKFKWEARKSLIVITVFKKRVQ